jgi:site-specific DNA-adenine methylase
MWSYYGAKTNIIGMYPPPKYDKIIEPFCGTARYALKYFDREVLLVDKYEVVVRIWQWLQQCSPSDILSLPRKLELEQTLDDFTFDCIEAKWLMGFLIKKGVQSPTLKTTKWCAIQRPNFTNFSLQRIAKNLFKIKHWEIRQGSYEDIANEKATWFIDPPYQFGGHAYKENNKKIDFKYLSEWCKCRQGQVIVCETMKANWMDFIPLSSQKTSAGWQREAIWSNEKTAYDHQQIKMF